MCSQLAGSDEDESDFREKPHGNTLTVVSLLYLIESQMDLQLNGTTFASGLTNLLDKRERL